MTATTSVQLYANILTNGINSSLPLQSGQSSGFLTGLGQTMSPAQANYFLSCQSSYGGSSGNLISPNLANSGQMMLPLQSVPTTTSQQHHTSVLSQSANAVQTELLSPHQNNQPQLSYSQHHQTQTVQEQHATSNSHQHMHQAISGIYATLAHAPAEPGASTTGGEIPEVLTTTGLMPTGSAMTISTPLATQLGQLTNFVPFSLTPVSAASQTGSQYAARFPTNLEEQHSIAANQSPQKKNMDGQTQNLHSLQQAQQRSPQQSVHQQQLGNPQSNSFSLDAYGNCKIALRAPASTCANGFSSASLQCITGQLPNGELKIPGNTSFVTRFSLKINDKIIYVPFRSDYNDKWNKT
ncbi:unnamed protein product [Protopolystoma xenopodis]|uniref:Uncharacterized protein n=1 Tax=Protopolystoma xenopodis TaxID=117903 RepID=A0A448XB70_9PLAT|nr:unnamed protein product [Protopolystoma xenopodis]